MRDRRNMLRHFSWWRSPWERLGASTLCVVALLLLSGSLALGQPGGDMLAQTGRGMEAVTISLDPASATVLLNQDFSIAVRVAAGSELPNSVGIVVQYDGTKLNNTGITNGTALPMVMVRQVGGTSGTLRYDAGRSNLRHPICRHSCCSLLRPLTGSPVPIAEPA